MQIQKSRIMAGSLRRLLHRNARGHVVNMLTKMRPPDIARAMLNLAERDQIALFGILMREDRQRAAETLSNLEPEQASSVLSNLTSQEVSEILQELQTDDAAEFISALPPEQAQEVLELMGVKESKEVQHLLQHQDETAGRIMTPNVFALREDLTVSEAINAIQTGTDLEMVFYLYVVDDRNHLVGVVSLRQLLMVPPSTPLRKIMTTDVISVTTETDQEEVARIVALYDLLGVPVVDSQHRLVGIITVDDIIDVIQEEATEDILHLAGVNQDDHVYTSRWDSFKRRIPWLTINLGTILGAVQVVALFEERIQQMPLLAVFLPVVAGLGGNAGTQTLTVTVRGLALGEVSWSSSRSVLLKEMTLGIFNGLTIGLLLGLVGWFWQGEPVFGMVLGVSMVGTLFFASIVGTIIPVTFKKLRVDPAIASSSLLTTLTDAVGFFIFLFLSTKYLLS
ncbi:MAG TPA: magnesium transporter [Acidobacteriota bacterium]|nr:magnesium transporter [Acidobacteriota bacterium]